MNEGLKSIPENQTSTNIIENHVEKKKIDLTKFGLTADSWLEKRLNTQTTEMVENVLADITDKISSSFFHNKEDVIKSIFKALNSHWEHKCQSSEDLRDCAYALIDIAKSQIRYDGYGKFIPAYGTYIDTEKFEIDAFSVEDLAEKAGGKFKGEFKRSITILTELIKIDVSTNYSEKKDPVSELWHLNRGGLSLSKQSLESIHRIFKSATENKYEMSQLISNIFGDRFAQDTGEYDKNRRAIYGPDETFKKWVEVSKNNSLEARLDIISKSFRYDGGFMDAKAFMDKFNKMTIEEQDKFIPIANKFLSVGVSPAVLILSMGNFSEWDLSKTGLDMVKESHHEDPYYHRKEWLGHCASVWESNPNNIEITASFFNKVLSSRKIETVRKQEYNVGNIKGLSAKELDQVQKDVDEELGIKEFKTTQEIHPVKELQEHATEVIKSTLEILYTNNNFDTIGKIKSLIPASSLLISLLDQEKANSLTNHYLIKFISSLGSEKENILPLTFAKAREMIFANLDSSLDLADYFLENFDKFYKQPWAGEGIEKAISHYSVADKFIQAIDGAVWKNEPWVDGLLVKAKVTIEEHQKQEDKDNNYQSGYGQGGYGFSEKDLHKSHPWLFDNKQAHLVSVLSNLMTNHGDVGQAESLGINAEQIAPILAEMNSKLNSSYKDFLNQIGSNPKISSEDKDAILKEGVSVNMTPLLDNVRNFAWRYIIQSVEGDVTKISEMQNLVKILDTVLAEGFKKYIKVHEIDIPLYDKLYEEFDNLRETGRYPLEVYLGRDGIYAWVGRRAQDVSRRRKLGLEGRRQLKERGEIAEINPQYTVYPRYFRDNLNYETKREFLEQEGISPEADPLFYDTGYTGTIPEQIMRVMDFSDEDIEKRIRLLSAPSAHRRVKGIAENARGEIIEYIEHNSKTENTAVGLIKDETTGRIRHIAEPTSPQEQFNYMMVKQAISRHYWLQEKLHHEPSGNVNLDSEHYTIRIRHEYANLLPQNFVHDPKTYLTEHGELLKGSMGEGEYPDEEIVLFKLEDGTEIVAKRIELRKAKEAKKEFSILISAKKAGLPTADPVGFLSGKTDSDSSYLLMKKLEGFSGRNFDKQLRAMNKYSEEQIKTIMQTIAQKNREVAELFRTTLKIDKRWRIKDTIIEFNQETGEVETVTPIDWERAQNYNPETSEEIDEII